MSYGIIRVQKFTAGAVSGIQKHDRRETEISNTNPDIIRERTTQNYSLHDDHDERSFYQSVKQRIEGLDLKRAVRKDAIVMAQILVTSDYYFFDRLERDSFFDKSDKSYTHEYFQKSYDFIAEKYGKENIISATIHLDEATPHMHINLVPVTDDGRLSAKELFTPNTKNGKGTISKLHDEFYEQVGKSFGLDRGRENTERQKIRHLETAEYKLSVQELNDEAEILKAEIADLKNEATESLLSVEKLKTEVQVIEGEKNALRKEIAVLNTARDEVHAVINTSVNNAISSGQFSSMANFKEQIQQKRLEQQQGNRLSLLEKFVALPKIKPIFDEFIKQLQKAGRDHGNER